MTASLALLCSHILSRQCSTGSCHIFFPNFPCLSLFFLNLPCCISFFFCFPCCGAPLLAMALPPSHFLFLSLLGAKHRYKHVSMTTKDYSQRSWMSLHLLMLTIAVFPEFFNTSPHSSSSPRILYL